jgi:uncharacterized protein YgfB (UPF0149 family)
MTLTIYTNAHYEDERALCNGEEIIMKGDAYHDKIIQWIDGFLEGLGYADIEFELEEEIIDSTHEMYVELDFYNEDGD